VLRAAPEIRDTARANRAFLQRVHADALLTGTGITGIVLADLREPEVILADPGVGELIDFGRPVGLLLVAILHFITDAEDPGRIVATLRDALAPGSYLALSYATGDFRTDAARQAAAVYAQATSTMTLRGREQIAGFFDGWNLVEPGWCSCPCGGRRARRPARGTSARSGATVASAALAHSDRRRVRRPCAGKRKKRQVGAPGRPGRPAVTVSRPNSSICSSRSRACGDPRKSGAASSARTTLSRVVNAVIRCAEGSDKTVPSAAVEASSAPERSQMPARSMPASALPPNQCCSPGPGRRTS
jgi:S-adenosyl methyltransferase